MASDFLTKGKFQVNMNLRGQVANVKAGANAAMKKEAARLQSIMRAKARIDTGRMRDSTTVRAVGGKNPRMEVTAVDYALYQDQGTIYIEPSFYITGTVSAERKNTLKNIAKENKKRSAARARRQRRGR